MTPFGSRHPKRTLATLLVLSLLAFGYQYPGAPAWAVASLALVMGFMLAVWALVDAHAVLLGRAMSEHRLGSSAQRGRLHSDRWLTRRSRLLVRLHQRRQRLSAREHRRLQSISARTAAALNATSVALVVQRQDGRIEWINSAALALFGLPQVAMQGDRGSMAVPSELESHAMALWRRIDAETRQPDCDGSKVLGLTINGVVVPVRVVHRMVTVDRSRWLILECIDTRPELERLTHLHQRIDAAETARKSQNNFLAAVSHDLRTPISGLLGMMDLLQRSELGTDQQLWLRSAKASGRHLRKLVDQLLDLSKIEAGKLTLEEIPFDIVEQFAPLVHAAQVQARRKGVQFSVVCDVENRVFLGDPVRVNQVLTNLLDNALKFTNQGAVQLKIWAVDRQEDRCSLIIEVRDSGVGIDPSRLENIFQPYAQGSSDVTRRFGGTGLGLTITRELCERMGGGVTASANPDRGTTFRALLELKLAHGMSPFSDTMPVSDPDDAGLRGRSILVADDNRIHQVLLQRWLSEEGVHVTVVGDGQQAVQSALEQRFDLLLMDVSMPNMNGRSATRAIRNLSKDEQALGRTAADVPIIGISAHAMPADQERHLSAGMSDYVTKPLRREHLLRKIRDSLSVH
jgi:two-component system, sensor histidine kinase